MRGYNDPERTAEEVLVDEVDHTGDIGQLDADGYLSITDYKDLMKASGGKYVAPARSERDRRQHPVRVPGGRGRGRPQVHLRAADDGQDNLAK